MFEHFSTQAKRALLFARQEVNREGGNRVEAKHLLLGILRQPNAGIRNFFGLWNVGCNELYHKLSGTTSEELDEEENANVPLSDEVIRVIRFARKESNQFGSNQADQEHLFLGLLEVSEHPILSESGVQLKRARSILLRKPVEYKIAAIFLLTNSLIWGVAFIALPVSPMVRDREGEVTILFVILDLMLAIGIWRNAPKMIRLAEYRTTLGILLYFTIEDWDWVMILVKSLFSLSVAALLIGRPGNRRILIATITGALMLCLKLLILGSLLIYSLPPSLT